jgi:hypothetical protein
MTGFNGMSTSRYLGIFVNLSRESHESDRSYFMRLEHDSAFIADSQVLDRGRGSSSSPRGSVTMYVPKCQNLGELD